METVNQTIHVRYESGVPVVTLLLERVMSDSDIQQIAQAIKPVIPDKKPGLLILDFENVTGVSSSFLGFLIKLKKKLESQESRLAICGLDRKVKNSPNDRYVNEVFKVVRLDTFFDIFPDAQAAISKRPVTDCPNDA